MQQQPVGSMKKIVSLVDRGAFDNVVYPQSERNTVFQPVYKPYHNFVSDIVEWPFTGVAEWGKRLTFTVPQPWQVDMISWIALRIKPFHWLPTDVYKHIYETQDWGYKSPTDEWKYAKSLGTCAIAKAEMEVDGVIVEQWSGDWCDVWSKMALDCNKGVGWDDSIVGKRGLTEDGYVYCYLPFWFSRWTNTAYPLLSTKGAVRFHITLRPFRDVVERVGGRVSCDDTPLGTTFKARDLTIPFPRYRDVTISNATPTMETAELICGTVQLDGPIRTAYRESPHEVMMSPVTEIPFGEPLKYVVGIPTGDRINIALPLSVNGPIRQLAWFLRRKDAVQKETDWTNYSGVLSGSADPVWNPRRPFLRRAQLMVGTAVWADEEESWWRSQGALPLAGGIRAYGNYLYVYNFTEKPNEFDPAGSVNASRVDLRLNLEVEQPAGVEWEVVVFIVGTNWMRFENGIANILFMD